MTAYLLVDLDVQDKEGFERYKNEVPALIAKHGGEYLIRGGEFEVIEGDWQPSRLVLFSFPDRGAIRAFFDDPSYAELKVLRHRTANSIVVAIDGVD
ncbi:MAG: DUF1330 domain-containing protein [Pseudomonadota bacterium]|nr:DUF1330 domain-containing protein [Pseudomonadota bacterium]